MTRILIVGTMCLTLSGCDIIEDIIHPPSNTPDAEIDSGFKDEARQLGLSDNVIERLCVATKKIETHCINSVDSDGVREVKVQYIMDEAVIKNGNAKSYNVSTVVFHLSTDKASSKVYFENTRTYKQNGGFTYTWEEPEDFATANIVLSSDSENPIVLTNNTSVEEVSADELAEIAFIELSNDDFKRVTAAEIMDDATLVQFPSLIYYLTADDESAAEDNSFAMYTGGQSNIIGNFGAVIADAIEEVWF